MKKNLSFGCAISMQLLFAIAVPAQSKTNSNTLQPPPPAVKIDGKLDEWGDSLRYYNEEKKLNYTLANDNDNLYAAIRINDRSEQARILGAGLTLSINTKGKKKGDYTLTFPIAEAGMNNRLGMGARKPDESITQEDRDQLIRARLTKLRDIKVTGFKDIEGDIITTTNTYGIKTAIDYDANGYLIYEASIPLKLFGSFKAGKDEWAFNFKINGLTKPEMGEGGMRRGGGAGGMGGGGGGGGGMGGGMRGGGMGGRRGGGMRSGSNIGENTASADRAELFKYVDFWEKYFLNK